MKKCVDEVTELEEGMVIRCQRNDDSFIGYCSGDHWLLVPGKWYTIIGVVVHNFWTELYFEEIDGSFSSVLFWDDDEQTHVVQN